MLIYMFDFVPYYLCAICCLLGTNQSWLEDWSLIHAGAAAQVLLSFVDWVPTRPGWKTGLWYMLEQLHKCYYLLLTGYQPDLAGRLVIDTCWSSCTSVIICCLLGTNQTWLEDWSLVHAGAAAQVLLSFVDWVPTRPGWKTGHWYMLEQLHKCYYLLFTGY